MATVIFYEKPECINNTKQKALLKAAGHTVEARNILTEAWTATRLRRFFGSLPVADWFNRAAPQVKAGEVIPDQVDAETALRLMLANPLLIRRPLLQVEGRREAGFDTMRVNAWIGLQANSMHQQRLRDHLIRQDLQTCPNDLKAGKEDCPSA